MRMMFVILLMLFTSTSFLSAQNLEGYVIRAMIIDDDTVLMANLPQVIVKDQRTFKSERQLRRHNRLIRNVKIVYPYAKHAGKLLEEYSNQLAKIDNPRERRILMKKAEDDLKERYGEELKNLTWTQGIILIKLIDRETKHTSYELVKDLRGSLAAFLWQSLARIFSINLKAHYDSAGEDREIEDIILLIETGEV